MPDKQIRSDEVRRNFAALIDEVRTEQAHITILRYDKAVAVIVPVEWYQNGGDQ